MKYLTSCLLGLLALSSVGCTALTGKTAGQNIDDATITSEVKGKLAVDRASSLTRVNVDTSKGVVYLNGIVADERDRERAAEVAAEVNGVHRVVNNLTVENPNVTRR